MDEKLPPEGIQPVFPSHPRQIVTGYPITIVTQPIRKRPAAAPATVAPAAPSAFGKCKYYCLIFGILFFMIYILALASLLSFPIFCKHYVPELPSISLKSMSMTAITNASDTQVKANLEIVFDPVENKNKHNTIIYDHVIVTAFDIKNGFFSNATFEQRGKDKTTVVVRIDGVTVDVQEYEEHIYRRYGVSYLNFDVAGFVRIEGGKWVVRPKASMRARCGGPFKVVFPLYQWNQTQRLDLQPTICEVDGDWLSFISKWEGIIFAFTFIPFFISVFILAFVGHRNRH